MFEFSRFHNCPCTTALEHIAVQVPTTSISHRCPWSHVHNLSPLHLVEWISPVASKSRPELTLCSGWEVAFCNLWCKCHFIILLCNSVFDNLFEASSALMTSTRSLSWNENPHYSILYKSWNELWYTDAEIEHFGMSSTSLIELLASCEPNHGLRRYEPILEPKYMTNIVSYKVFQDWNWPSWQ